MIVPIIIYSRRTFDVHTLYIYHILHTIIQCGVCILCSTEEEKKHNSTRTHKWCALHLSIFPAVRKYRAVKVILVGERLH